MILNGYTTDNFFDELTRGSSRLRSEPLFGATDKIIARGPHEYLNQTQRKLNGIDQAINDCFFQFEPAAAPYKAAPQGSNP